MKSALLVLLLAAAATAAVVSNDVPDMAELPELDEVADVGEVPEVFVTDVGELIDEAELPAGAEEETQTGVDSRRSLSAGTIGSSDTRVHNTEYRANGVAGHFHLRDIRVSTNRRVTAVRVTRLGNSQGATPSIIAGGVGSSFVTVSIRSAVGRGYHYRVQVYVR